MLLSISRSLLWLGLQHVARAISSKSVVPILSGILVQADEETVSLTASNATMMLRYQMDGESMIGTQYDQPSTGASIVERGGSVVIPARYWIEIIRQVEAEDIVSIEVLANDRVRISAGRAVYHLTGMDPRMYPVMKKLDPQLTAQLICPNDELRRLIQQVSFAASASEARPVLTGVACQIAGRQFTMIATDGVRLALRTALSEKATELEQADCPIHSNAELSVIVPAKHLDEYAKAAAYSQGTTAMQLSGNTIVLESGRLAMQSVVLEGAYPPLEKLLASIDACSTEIVVDTHTLLHALERAVLMAGDSCTVNMHTNSSTSITLFANSAEIGDIREEIDMMGMVGEPLAISYNARYMADIMKAIHAPQARLRMSGSWRPIIITPANDDAAFYALTPIRTRR